LITSQGNALVLNEVIAETIDKITIMSLRDKNGEFFRKLATDITEVSGVKNVYTFYLNENEGNGNIVEVGLHGNGATTTLGSGMCYATQSLIINKDNTQSLNIDWTVEVKQ